MCIDIFLLFVHQKPFCGCMLSVTYLSNCNFWGRLLKFSGEMNLVNFWQCAQVVFFYSCTQASMGKHINLVVAITPSLFIGVQIQTPIYIFSWNGFGQFLTVCTGILLLFFHPKLLWVDTCYCHIGLVAATFPQDTVRRAVGGSENLKGQVVIQGLLKMNILLLIRSNCEWGGRQCGPLPPCSDVPAPELLLDPHGQSHLSWI